ncbi:aminoglycoside phosphotransferase protein [Venturia nashicola]|uniref:Aminoglycoside phosphotransferase protein n=1 Tax=Venturia nashicola TaxID=86259 RepID=A0A4Z1PTN9_9PEZI|nr:aminoglycoside phosphotransferase protein [Venturia nashicola]
MFALRKRFTNSSKSAPKHHIPTSEERKQQPKESRLKRLLSHKPRQQQVPTRTSEDTLPNRLISTATIHPLQETVGSPNGTQNISKNTPWRKSTIRLVQTSIDQIYGFQANDPERNSVNKSGSNPSLLNDPDVTLVGDEGDRDICGSLNTWPEANLEALAMEHASSPSITSAHGVRYVKGRNNHIAIMRYEPSGDKCVIRMPTCGWGPKWTEKDQIGLERSSETMRYLKGRTKIPIPSIIGYDVKRTNTLGAPYMLLEYIEGDDLLELWWGKTATVDSTTIKELDHERCSGDEEDIFGGFYRKVYPDLEQTRQHILKSLAFAMAELRSLTFDQLGTFAPTKEGTPPTIEPTNLQYPGTRSEENSGRFSQKHKQRKTYNSSRAWLESCLNRYLDEIKSHAVRSYRARTADDLQQDLDLMNGLHKLYGLIIPELPFPNPGEQETFLLGLPNFGSHDILVDNEGNVTGILDWENVETRPQYLGWNTPPGWLFPEHESPESGGHSGSRQSMTPFEYIRYREDYAKYLREACGADSDDWKNSTKSYIYSMAVEGIAKLDESKMTETLIMILSSFMPANTDFQSFIRQIGKPNQMDEELEEYLKEQFRKVLATEEQHIIQQIQPCDKEPHAKQIAPNTTLLDDPTSFVQESSTQMAFSQRNEQQNSLRPQNRRQKGYQIMNSPISNTFNPQTFPAIQNRDIQPSPIHTLSRYPDQSSYFPRGLKQPPVARVQQTLATSVPHTIDSTKHNPERYSSQPFLLPIRSKPSTQALHTAPAIENVQPRSTTPEMNIPGEWPVDAKEHLLNDHVDHQTALGTVEMQGPGIEAGNVRPRRNSLGILRIAGAWPVNGDATLVFEPVESAERCVIL